MISDQIALHSVQLPLFIVSFTVKLAFSRRCDLGFLVEETIGVFTTNLSTRDINLLRAP